MDAFRRRKRLDLAQRDTCNIIARRESGLICFNIKSSRPGKFLITSLKQAHHSTEHNDMCLSFSGGMYFVKWNDHQGLSTDLVTVLDAESLWVSVLCDDRACGTSPSSKPFTEPDTTMPLSSACAFPSVTDPCRVGMYSALVMGDDVG